MLLSLRHPNPLLAIFAVFHITRRYILHRIYFIQAWQTSISSNINIIISYSRNPDSKMLAVCQQSLANLIMIREDSYPLSSLNYHYLQYLYYSTITEM